MEPLEDYTFDFVVVGGGNSGAVVAGQLARSNAKPSVLLIEAGGSNSRPDLRVASERFINVYKNEVVGTRYETTPQKHLGGRVLEYLRGRGLGGSSIANFLAYIRGSASDYNYWAEAVGDDSWAWKNVVERFKEIENLHFDDDGDEFVRPVWSAHGYDGPLDITLPARKQWPQGTEAIAKACQEFGWQINPDQNSGNIVGVGSVTTTAYKGYRVTSASAYLANPPSNLHIWTDSVATQILFESEPKKGKLKTVGVRLADGREVRAAKEIILSLGSIDTPKLLLLSGVGPKRELEALDIPCFIDHPNIGKGLIDHNYITMKWGMTADFADRVRFQKDSKAVAAARAEWMRSRSGPDATRNLMNLIGFLKFDPQRCSSEELEKLDPMMKRWIKEPNVPQFEAFIQGYVPDDWDTKFGDEALGVGVMLMNPQSRGAVTLASKDPAAYPLIDVNFFSHPYDRRTLVDAVREVLTFVKTTSLSKHVVSKVEGPKSESDDDILAFCQESLMSVLHGVGTAKMGRKDDPKACVDTDFCLRGVDGLRVIDLSICPLITNNHTQATAYVVGQMGWKRLAADYNLRLGLSRL